MSALLAALATAGLAVATVGLWTARVALTSRSRSAAAALLAAIEATVFVTVVARLMRDLDDPVQLIAYAAGVATGTTIAVRTIRSIDPPVLKVESVVPGDGDQLLRTLHQDGWPTTTSEAEGLRGPVTTVSVTTTADRLPALEAAIARSATDAFWTVAELRSARPTALPEGFVEVTPPARRRRRRQPLLAMAAGSVPR